MIKNTGTKNKKRITESLKLNESASTEFVEICKTKPIWDCMSAINQALESIGEKAWFKKIDEFKEFFNKLSAEEKAEFKAAYSEIYGEPLRLNRVTDKFAFFEDCIYPIFYENSEEENGRGFFLDSFDRLKEFGSFENICQKAKEILVGSEAEVEKAEEKVEEDKKDNKDLTKVSWTYSKALNDRIQDVYAMYADPSCNVNIMKAKIKEIVAKAADTDAKKGFLLNLEKQRTKDGIVFLITNVILKADKDTALVGHGWSSEKGSKASECLKEEFNKAELDGLIKDLEFDFSDEAIQAAYDVVDMMSENQDAYISDLVWEALDTTFMYYSDAFDYLKAQNCTDMKEPVDQGFYDVSQIATYYCEQEVYEICRKIGLDI